MISILLSSQTSGFFPPRKIFNVKYEYEYVILTQYISHPGMSLTIKSRWLRQRIIAVFGAFNYPFRNLSLTHPMLIKSSELASANKNQKPFGNFSAWCPPCLWSLWIMKRNSRSVGVVACVCACVCTEGNECVSVCVFLKLILWPQSTNSIRFTAPKWARS